MQRSQDQASIASRLLRNPLEVIAETHLREREICARIDRIAATGLVEGEDLHQVLAFLGEELPLHLQDEEEDLFPLLKRRCEPEEEIDKVIERLHANHQESLVSTARVIAILEAMETSETALVPAERDQLTSFTAHARRHLIVENAIILPIARGSLTTDDLTTLGLRMRRRRSLDTASEKQNAE